MIALALILGAFQPAPPADGLVTTAPKAPVPVVSAAAEPVQTLPKPSEWMVSPGSNGGPGANCSVAYHNSIAVADGDGNVFLGMSTAEQLRRFGRVQDVYSPGDPGYAQARGYADQGVLCSGSSIETPQRR